MSFLLPTVLTACLLVVGQPVSAKNKALANFDAAALQALGPSPESSSLPARGSVEVAFSPNGACTEATVRFIGEAKHSIRLAAYGLTSVPIGKALMEAFKRGVDVKLVVDREHNGRRNTPTSVANFLATNGVPVRIDTAVRIQHNKVLIVDGKSVQNGSFNFTSAAQTSNAENIVIHRDFPELAELFTRNWNHLWEQSQAYQASY